MRTAFVTIAAVVLAACGNDNDGGRDGDAALDWGEWTDFGADTDAADTPLADPADPDADAVTGEGQFITRVPSDVGGTDGIIVRVSHPAEDAARHAQGAPVVVQVPGGHGPGSLGIDEPDPMALVTGTVVIELILPGGREPGYWSGGVYDYRGPDCQAALKDVLRYAMGQIADRDGVMLTDRVPWADTSLVGLVGLSNGGNLALTTLASFGTVLSGVDFFVAWESPIGDQYATAELGAVSDAVDNPFYTAGTCTITSCPWPGMDDVLRWDSSETARITDPIDGSTWPVAGLFFLDVDGNEVLGDHEFVIHGLGGPGEVVEGTHRPWLYYSTEFAAILDEQLDTFFPLGKPIWMASPDQIREYWAVRDGALSFADVHASLPDLLVTIVGTATDHVQTQPDHPHLRSQIDGWLDAGHGWVRVNPDAAYVALLSGEPAGGIPENDAGSVLPWPDTELSLLPETLQDFAVDAAVMELADRVRDENVDADLDAVLY
jgi:hypothetical protein